MANLREKDIQIESLGCSLRIRELTARAHIEMIQSTGEFDSMFIAMKHGVPAWADKSIDDLKDELSMRQAMEVSRPILELSGVPIGKNSESDPDAASFSG
jgi:hypothetical protein